jgi:hypothetical protein
VQIGARQQQAIGVIGETRRGGKVYRGTYGGSPTPARDYPMHVRWFQSGKLPLDLCEPPLKLAQINEACARSSAARCWGVRLSRWRDGPRPPTSRREEIDAELLSYWPQRTGRVFCIARAIEAEPQAAARRRAWPETHVTNLYHLRKARLAANS